MRGTKKLFGLAIVCGSAACVHYEPLRASSLQGTDPASAHVLLREPSQDVARTLEQLFAQRGYVVTNKVVSKAGVSYYLFNGMRQNVMELYASRYQASVQSYVIGSWFAARLETVPGGTDLLILGKPTVNGIEVCSDEDRLLADVQYWCRDTRIRVDSSDRQFMTGREERETAKGVVVTLMDQQPSGLRVVFDHGIPIGERVDAKHQTSEQPPADLMVSGKKESPDAGR